EAGDPDTVLEAAIEAGADDCESNQDSHIITTDAASLHEVAAELEAKLGPAESAALIWKPQTTLALGEEDAETLLKMLAALDENDDVQNVYANFEIDEAVMEKLTA
ncbi:MAG TPA: YebC/PmpR family DNA-binding transcriptional regulator, partial [Alphaproteobacteria bacterium]|nr:YebC/PmpR family DNA-binding transcriptional regulator [Alphaproteobacteria bacterium]